MDCPTPYDHATWAAEMADADASLAVGDLENARARLSSIHRQVPCLDKVASPAYLARLDRQLALTFYFDQDDDAVWRWSVGANDADAKAAWSADFSAEHPFRAAVEAAKPNVMGGPEDKGWLVPKKGGAFVDGHPIPSPKVPAEVPLLVQIADGKGVILDAWWQDGAAFPDRALSEKVAAIPTPAWFTPETAPPVVAVAAVEVPVVAAVEVAPVVEVPPVVAVATPEPLPATIDAAELAKPLPAGVYVDPFVDAHRRALYREVVERNNTDAAGNTSVVRTEVVTFAADPAMGELVSQKLFGEFMNEFPEWKPGGANAAKAADSHYLLAFDPNSDDPVIWISGPAAQAYCASWGNDLPHVSDTRNGKLREWRLMDGGMVLRSVEGVPAVADPAFTDSNLGFRCAD